MKFDPQRTIVALSSGAIPGRRAIVRLSGSNTPDILHKLFVGEHDVGLLSAQDARSQEVCCSLSWAGRTVNAQAYYWPNTRSFTGEPCAELHLIGCLPIVESLIERVCELGAAHAERGEFTLRSFLAGKIDLTQAEAVLGVIEAEGDEELHAALSQLGGNLSRPVRQMRDELLELISHLEAGLDFVEEDIEFISAAELTRQLRMINDRINSLINQINTRDARESAIQVVIVGLPNAGKSSLFNAIVGNERAIVSAQAGTTRDVISQRVAIGGLEMELIDTAGLEGLDDQTPRAAAQVALHNRLRTADLALLCFDSSESMDKDWIQSQTEWLKTFGMEVICVGTKSDQHACELENSCVDILVSSRTGTGLTELQQVIATRLSQHRRELQSEAMHFTAVRCVNSLKRAHATFEQAIELSETEAGEELVAAELRIGLEDLSAIIGDVHSEDILGEIFSRFCIGK